MGRPLSYLCPSEKLTHVSSCPRSYDGDMSQRESQWPRETMFTALCPLSVPAVTLHFPFCQRNFSGGCSSEPRHSQFLRCLGEFQFRRGLDSLPFWFSLYSEARKKGNADGRTRAGRVVRRWRRKCQRKWALCLDGSVSYPRKPPLSTPEGRWIYVSSHTRAAGFDNGTIPVSFSIHGEPKDNAIGKGHYDRLTERAGG